MKSARVMTGRGALILDCVGELPSFVRATENTKDEMRFRCLSSTDDCSSSQ